MTDVVGVSSEAVAMDLIGRVFGLSDVHLAEVCGVGGHESLVERGEEPVAMAARRKRMAGSSSRLRTGSARGSRRPARH